MDSIPYGISVTVTDHEGRSHTLDLAEGTHTIGRAPDCDVCVPDHFKTVSRRHAVFEVSPNGVAVEDLGSGAGISVNGAIVHRQKLENGDVVRLGGELGLRVHLPESEVVSDPHAVFGEDVAAQDVAADLQEISDTTQEAFVEIGKRIVGQSEVVACVWAALLSRGHCLLIGVPGLAKTLLVSTIGEVLQLDFNRVQFTPDLMPSDIIGSQVLNQRSDGQVEFEFEQGPVFTQLLLADEINRTPPKTQAALLQAMQEREVTVSRNTYKLGPPFCVIATQNPIEQEGTYPLPEAQQDRFMFSIILDYPDRDEEIEVLNRLAGNEREPVNNIVTYETILRFQQTVDGVAIPAELIARIADLVRATRPGDDKANEVIRDVVDWGAGPRAGQALIAGAKAFAAMSGRPAIIWHDVLRIVKPVLRHRISCNYRARSKGMTPDDVIDLVLKQFEL